MDNVFNVEILTTSQQNIIHSRLKSKAELIFLFPRNRVNVTSHDIENGSQLLSSANLVSLTFTN